MKLVSTRTLVITDNEKQYERLLAITRKKKFKELLFDFRHSPKKSPLASHSDFKAKSASIDVKREATQIKNNYDLVISLHCKQLFPAELIEAVRCVNVHPGYNPINRGWYPQVFALCYGRVAGATIHVMDEKLDHGPIIARKKVEHFSHDTSLTLYERILTAEMDLLEDNLESIILDSYTAKEPEIEGSLHLKSHFLDLCHLQLEEKGSFESFYNRLRSLTHGSYRNAFFVDPQTQKRVYVSINIYPEDG